MTRTMMLCGHTAQGKASDSKPVCVICDEHRVIDAPVLEGRQAICYCGTLRPSSLSLAFFEYRGPGSQKAKTRCKCGYVDIAHTPGAGLDCKKFEPRGPYEYDSFYCGCRGWD